ncbi:MAG: hypothetical protein JWP25_3447 [Bradyrhizobium sp.]|nr:hypothetical protein [Bradyrhizobium sp.]MEA2869323.1 hypothetical protein [Bradyrhizobium sp.]
MRIADDGGRHSRGEPADHNIGPHQITEENREHDDHKLATPLHRATVALEQRVLRSQRRQFMFKLGDFLGLGAFLGMSYRVTA